MSERESAVAGPWRRALKAVIVLSLLCAPVSWVDDGITPSWIVYPIVLLLALWRLRGGNGALLVGVVALVFLLVHLPFTWAALSGDDTSPSNPDLPTSPFQWVVTLFVVPALTSAVGWITWLSQRSSLHQVASIREVVVMPGWLNFLIVLALVVVLLSWFGLRDVILVGSTTCVFVGTVLRMWDSVAEADNAGEFASHFSRSTSDEFHRLFVYFTPLERWEHAATSDRELYYLRTAQGWFFLSAGSFGALLLAIGSVRS